MTSPERAVHRRQPMTAADRRSLTGMAVVILVLHLAGWGILIGLATTHQFTGAAGAVFNLGLGVTVYALGLRHAFDADHIAAIDNTTRQLMQVGKHPQSVGFWFSLGHSTVVFTVCLLLAFGVRALASHLGDGSGLMEIFSTFGLVVSALFLVILAGVNLGSFVGTAGLVRQARQGAPVDEAQLSNRGVITRLIGGRLQAIRSPWQIYPIGLLFGLGFDTATEVGLLVLTSTAAAVTLPWYAVLSLPILFAAGMALLDTVDGVFMNRVYGWAFDQPARKLYYNLVVTGVSIVFALGIGVVEIATLLTGTFKITSGPLAFIGRLDLQWVGFVLVGLFAVIAAVVWLRSRRRTVRAVPEEPVQSA